MRDLLLLTVLVGLVPAILARPWLGILAWYWIGLMNPHRFGWGFITDAPVAMLVGLVTLFGLLFTRERRGIPVTTETVLLLLFAAYITMTTLTAWVPDEAWAQWEKVMKILLMTFVTPLLIYGGRRIAALLLVIALSIGFFGFKGGLFAIATGGSHMVLGPNGSFIEGNTTLGLAMIMVLPLLLVSARLLRERRIDLPLLTHWPTRLGYGLYAAFWLTIVAILATYSRGALIGLLAVAPLLFWHMRRKAVLVTLLVLAVGVTGVSVPDKLLDRWRTVESYQEDHSAMQRIQAWGVNWNIAVENPALGAGFRMASMPDQVWLGYANWVEPWASRARAAHSIYFQVLGHHGLAGAGLFFALLGSTLLTLRRIRRQASDRGVVWLAEYAWAIQVSLFGYLVAGTFLDVAYFDLLFVFVALSVVMQRELAQLPADRREASDYPTGAPASPRYPDFVATAAEHHGPSR